MIQVTEYSKTCEFCGRLFHDRQSYGQHKRRQHPGWRNGTAAELPVPETSSYEYEVCHRTFATRQSLSAHTRWCKNQHEKEPHPLGDDSGTAPVDEPITGLFCCYCGTDLSDVLQAMIPTFCPRCGKNIRKVLDLLSFSMAVEE